jgi:outer membrane protein OmpA-like peptidoglycan-associated protein
MSDVLFDTGKYTLRQEAREKLARIAGIVLNYPDLKLEAEGHTDNVGGFEFNLNLSRKRAEAVVTALTSQYGIASFRLTPNGVAYLAPVANNTTEEGRAKNRRVELVPQ